MNRTAFPMHQAGTDIPTFTLGQRIIVAEPGTWLQGRVGTVKALPTRNGINLVAVEIDGDTPLGPVPVRWIDPRRVAPASTCETCAGGCDCDGSAEHPGCGHWACWGPATITTALPECPGVAAERAQSAAYKFARGWTR